MWKPLPLRLDFFPDRCKYDFLFTYSLHMIVPILDSNNFFMLLFFNHLISLKDHSVQILSTKLDISIGRRITYLIKSSQIYVKEIYNI